MHRQALLRLPPPARRAPARQRPRLDLPSARRRRTRSSSRIRTVCCPGRAAGPAVAAPRLAAYSRRDLGRHHRVLRLDLSPYASREFISRARRRSGVQWRIHPTLHTASALSVRTDAPDPDRAWKPAADSESHGVRYSAIEDEAGVISARVLSARPARSGRDRRRGDYERESTNPQSSWFQTVACRPAASPLQLADRSGSA